MAESIKFDPTKPYGQIWGLSVLYPGAKYQQGPYIFDAHRKCLNSDIKVEVPTEVQSATADLKKKLGKEADAALVKLQVAAAKHEEESSPQSKGAYTKAYNAYQTSQAKLDKLTEA